MLAYVNEKISEYLEQITNFGFTGTVLIGRGKEIIHTEGYGFANRLKRIKNSTSTFHDIGSLTKQFTAAGVLKLEMEGKLTTEDTLDQFFERVPHDKKSITLHQLLTHTSGIHDSSSDDYDIVTKEQAITNILSSPSYEKNQYHYSNDGYTLLAAIIESVSSQPYEDFIYHHLFVPSNMHDTGYTIPKFNDDQVANGYVKDEDCGKPTEKNYPFWNLIGNGGMLSTASDLFKWHCSLLEDNVLSKEAKQKLFTPFLQNYAYGWKVSTTPYGKVIEHGGASSYGTCAKVVRYIDEDIVMIVLCNQFTLNSNGMAKIVAEKLSKIIFGGEVKIPSKLTQSREKNTKTIIKKGEYQYKLSTGGHFTVHSQEEKIILSSFDQDCIDLFISMEEGKEYINGITSSSLEITKDILKGYYTSLEASLENKQIFIGRKTVIEKYLGKRRNLKSMKHCGSLPSTFIPGTLEVRFHLCFEEDDVNLLFFWKNEKIEFIGFVSELVPISIESINNEDNYIAYSIEHESFISFTFPNGNIETISFISKQGECLKASICTNQ